MCDRLARAITCMFCHDLHLILLCSGLLQKDLAELYFQQNSCHTRIAAFFPLPSSCISSLLMLLDPIIYPGTESVQLEMLQLELTTCSK